MINNTFTTLTHVAQTSDTLRSRLHFAPTPRVDSWPISVFIITTSLRCTSPTKAQHHGLQPGVSRKDKRIRKGEFMCFCLPEVEKTLWSATSKSVVPGRPQLLEGDVGHLFQKA